MTTNKRITDLHYLIDCLKTEMPEYTDMPVSDNLNEAFNQYRALCNVRLPNGRKLPGKYYDVESQVLTAITEEKGITNAESIPTSALDDRIALWQGDITTLSVDAIVNAANSQMMGCFQPLHSCIDNMIHTMAGVRLREKCEQIMTIQGAEEPTGSAKITPAYNLPAQYVLHTVGPIVDGPLTKRHKDLLTSCYTSCLELAAANGCVSVAFCCISTGVFRFPQDKAAQIAVKTVRNWLDQHPDLSIKKVIFNVFKDDDKALYDVILNE